MFDRPYQDNQTSNVNQELETIKANTQGTNSVYLIRPDGEPINVPNMSAQELQDALNKGYKRA